MKRSRRNAMPPIMLTANATVAGGESSVSDPDSCSKDAELLRKLVP